MNFEDYESLKTLESALSQYPVRSDTIRVESGDYGEIKITVIVKFPRPLHENIIPFVKEGVRSYFVRESFYEKVKYYLAAEIKKVAEKCSMFLKEIEKDSKQ
jgi:hypothetical protein